LLRNGLDFFCLSGLGVFLIRLAGIDSSIWSLAGFNNSRSVADIGRGWSLAGIAGG
jgi:hypothetical protein